MCLNMSTCLYFDNSRQKLDWILLTVLLLLQTIAQHSHVNILFSSPVYTLTVDLTNLRILEQEATVAGKPHNAAINFHQYGVCRQFDTSATRQNAIHK